MRILVVISTVISDCLNAVDWTVESGDPYIARFGVLFKKLEPSAYDDAINANASVSDWNRVIYCARVAEVGGYWSSNIEDKVKSALDNHPMVSNLPSIGAEGFQCTNRYLMNAFRYAELLNYRLDRWKKADAYNDFKGVYNVAQKPFLYCTPPSSYFCIGYGPRYYDESAETLDVFIRFYELGVSGTLIDIQTVWDYINTNLWSGTHYNYALSWSDWECEVEFFLIILRMRYWKWDIVNFDRCITDIKNRLTFSKWSSPQWAGYSIVHHNPANSQRRLWETLQAYVVLHAYYPLMDGTQKGNFVSMLKDSVRGCDGLIDSSGLYDGSVKKFRGTSGSAVDDNSTVWGCAVLFLSGIIPDTGYLMIPIFEECYAWSITVLNKYFSYDPINKKIRIPVRSGTLKFQFGSASPVSVNFENDGVYEITFTSDWNSVVSSEHVMQLDTDLIYSTQLVAPPPPPPITEKNVIDLGKGWGFRRWSVPQNRWI